MGNLFDLQLLHMTLRTVAPVLLAALGGLICERAGLFNVALEGMMLAGAFGAVLGSFFLGSAGWGVLAAIISAALVGLLLAFLSIHLRGNAIVVGISLNLLVTGLTTFLMRVVLKATGTFHDPQLKGLPAWDLPGIPVLSGHTPVVWLSYLAVPALTYFLFQTVTGLRIRAVGEHARAAQTLAVSPAKIQYLAVLICGLLTGLAGAQLSLGQVRLFQEEMTAGRGFIALVAVMFGRAHPVGVLGASLLFGLVDALGTRLQGAGLPSQVTLMLPFVVTLLALTTLRGRGLSGLTRRTATEE
jgi:ABC-type uncharacterized transport system permease subunit